MNPQQPLSRARSYQRYTVELILEPLAKRLVKAAGLRRGEIVLDVACGTGAVTRHAANAVGVAGRVTGLDLDADSLAVAVSMAPQAGEVVDWRQGDVGALPFRDAVFDAALCSQGLQFFPDRVRALREVCRVLVPGGRFVACVWQSVEHNPYYQALMQALGPHIDVETAARMKAPFALGNGAALRAPFIEAGLDVEIESLFLPLRMPSLEGFIPGHLSGMSVAEELGRLSSTVVKEVIRNVKSALGAHKNERGLRVPFAVHMALAHRCR